MNERIRTLLDKIRAGLRAIYGEDLCGVYLYGSYARGEEDDESDVDVLVVLEYFDSYGTEVERTGDLVAHLSLEYGLSISTVFVKEFEWHEKETPFLTNVREEAIPA